MPSQIRSDQKARAPEDLASQPWYERLQEAMDALKRDHGLVLGTDYNVLYQRASRSPAQRDAAGNVFRVYGHWSPFDAEATDAGSLVFKGEYRGRVGTAIAPQALGPKVGYAGLTAATYSNAGGVLTNFYWNQHLADNRFAFNVGVVDVSDYLDVYGLVNVWTDFNNLSFTTNPTIAIPKQGLGAAAGWNFAPNYYVLAGLADANGDPHDPGNAFKSFFDVREYFYHAEFGWFASYEQRYSDNVHVSAWSKDPRKDGGVDRGRGVAFSASKTVNERWLPFFRAGYSDGGDAVVDRAVSAGLGYRLSGSDDFVGFGAAWARAPGKGENQYSFEAYYRWQPFKHLQVVPDAQYIVNPVNAQSTSSLWVLGMKLRAAF